jgi:hypothetical protein
MAATIEKAKADDPRELYAPLTATCADILLAIQKTHAATPPPATAVPRERLTPPKAVGGSRPVPPARPARSAAQANGDGELADPERRILDSLAWWEAAGVAQPSREQTAFVARYSVNGHFNNTLGNMRTKGLVDYPAGNCVALTDAGRALAHGPEAAPTNEELIDRTRAVLREEPQRRLFTALVDAGEMLTREDLASRTNYSVNGHFNNTLGRLRSLGLVRYPKGNHVALSEIFDALP